MCSWPILEESTSTTTCGRRATIARLAAASAWSGVLRPWPTEMPLVPMNATSARSSAERRDRVRRRRRPGWSARTRPGSRCRSTLGDAGEPGGDRDRVGDDGQLQVAGEHHRQPGGRGARVEQHAAAGRREQGQRGRLAIRSFSSAWRQVALADAGSSARQRRGGDRAAVHPAQDARPAPATDRSRRTVSVVTAYSVGQRVHRQPAALRRPGRRWPAGVPRRTPGLLWVRG